MKVSELIAFLQTQPQDLPVVYRCYSEYDTLEVPDICIAKLCLPRPDGWVHDIRPDKAGRDYLVLPGN